MSDISKLTTNIVFVDTPAFLIEDKGHVVAKAAKSLFIDSFRAFVEHAKTRPDDVFYVLDFEYAPLDELHVSLVGGKYKVRYDTKSGER